MALKVIGGDVRMVDPAEYDKDIPRVQEHLRKFERAFGKVRGTHKGRPVDALTESQKRGSGPS